MKVRIRYFALYRDLTGVDEEELNVADNSSLGVLVNEVKDLHPIFRSQPGEFLLAVNAEYSPSNRVLSEGDEVAIFPNVSGG